MTTSSIIQHGLITRDSVKRDALAVALSMHAECNQALWQRALSTRPDVFDAYFSRRYVWLRRLHEGMYAQAIEGRLDVPTYERMRELRSAVQSGVLTYRQADDAMRAFLNERYYDGASPAQAIAAAAAGAGDPSPSSNDSKRRSSSCV